MSVDANKELGRRFFEAQDRMRGGPDPGLCAPTYTAHIGSNPPMTLAHHEGFAKAFYAAFPDLQHTVEETVADDEKVAVRFTLHGTHTGDFMGIPPTHKSFEAGAVAIFHIDKNEIVEVHGQFDQLGMMRQLGVIP